MFLIFDLDMTLVNSSSADEMRAQRAWHQVYPMIAGFKLFDGIADVLKELNRRAIAYAIVTASPRTYCEKVVQSFAFSPDFLVCYHDTKRHKPYPDPIESAIAHYGKTDEQIISFGDRDIDIFASNQAGVLSVGCLWGATQRNALQSSSPDFLIHHPYEILHIIDTIHAESITQD